MKLISLVMPSGFRFIFSQFQLATAVVIHISKLSTINLRKIGRFLHFNRTAFADDFSDPYPCESFCVCQQSRRTGFSREGAISAEEYLANAPDLLWERGLPAIQAAQGISHTGDHPHANSILYWLPDHLNSRINTQASTPSHQRSPK
jgi:hypothetical protein